MEDPKEALLNAELAAAAVAMEAVKNVVAALKRENTALDKKLAALKRKNTAHKGRKSG